MPGLGIATRLRGWRQVGGLGAFVASAGLVAAGCRCGSPVARPIVEVPVVQDLPPAQLADLAVPEHPDLGLGGVEAAQGPTGWWPAAAPGRWSAYRVWSARPERDWRAGEVQLWFDVSGAHHEREQLRAVGEVMEPFTTQRLGASGEGWGVLAARPSGKPELEPLANPELWLAPHGVAFHSVWVGGMVALELVGVQDVTVPAGTFRALHVKRTWGRGTRTNEEHAWWTADHGLVAQVVRAQGEQGVDARLVVLAAEGQATDRAELRQVWSDQRVAMGLAP